ncbi:hypothetical protein [Allokutzneria oryzae]|uniref:Lactococcin 972 family bacteriocin n=1 Tax=Allokutzneria oryzae TaxID=1378989 RepID=A0ABV5ZTW7_9PSEU
MRGLRGKVWTVGILTFSALLMQTVPTMAGAISATAWSDDNYASGYNHVSWRYGFRSTAVVCHKEMDGN